ncbi:DNA-binding transcriptional MerR regulator [Kribbella aluminosa]|uniref:DNA-binding transcriptional MerR regulator n=1 Tax=Kribbella aluminosa TaxID=416017 RepID=A0ABS4UK43_9ACTN|nr:chaperone modulator CbpM [Kribbella aluminosa]MBP2352022.1 DNA-binding transcriptional MerR regulator [Kribbella aluminosa]
MSTALARPLLLDLEAFARASGVHPDLIRRLTALGLLEPARVGAGRVWFRYDDVAAVARIQRLRAAFSLNYAAIGLVIDLLDRLAAQEAALRTRHPLRTRHFGDRTWT